MVLICNYSINNLDMVRELVLIEKKKNLRVKVQINQYFKGKKCYLPLLFLRKEKHGAAEKGGKLREGVYGFLLIFNFFHKTIVFDD